MTRRALEIGMAAGAATFLIAVPWLIPALTDTFWVSVITEILIWSLFAASVNLLFGYVGLLSFGQALYFGFGMYGVALGIDHFGLSFWPAFGLGIISAMAMALVSGVFAVRLSWHYFAIITVVFSLIFYFVAMSAKSITGGDDGLSFSAPPLWKAAGWLLTDRTVQYYFIYLVCAACFAGMAFLNGFPVALKTKTSFPFGIWFANATTLYVADEGNGMTGTTVTVSQGGLLSDPLGIAIAANGDIIVAVAGSPGSIVRVDPLSGAQTTLSSGGNLQNPVGVAIVP